MFVPSYLLKSPKRTLAYTTLFFWPRSVTQPVKFLGGEGRRNNSNGVNWPHFTAFSTAPEKPAHSLPIYTAHFIPTLNPCYVLIPQKAQYLSYQPIGFIPITAWWAGRLILGRKRPVTAGRRMLIGGFA